MIILVWLFNILKNVWIIQIFALLHAAVSLGCRMVGMADDLLLTLLTMLMVVILCLRRATNVVFMSTAVILANIVGFGLGKGIAALFDLTALPDMAVNPLSTFLCTQAVGFLVEFSARRPAFEDARGGDSKGLRWMLTAFVLIIILRLVITVLDSDLGFTRNFFIEVLVDYIFSCLAIVLVAEYAIRLRERAEKSAEEANLAHFRYQSLKQQVNPHFLFNSLNTLDCMIQENSNREASEYTHKLAEVYRYMLRSEDESLVRLSQEMDFVSRYMDLQRLRFGGGVELELNIADEAMNRSVVPCSVQLLVENALKHNAVRPDNPLKIEIRTTRNSVMVSNEKRPRLTPPRSAGMGQRYLRQCYKDIAGKSIVIRETEDKYIVILPLL